MAQIQNISQEQHASALADLQRKQPRSWTQQIIVDVIIWLLLNGTDLEEKKYQLLCQQDMQNIWRSAACAWLETAPADIWSWLQQDQTRTCLGELRDQIDFDVIAAVPGEGE